LFINACSAAFKSFTLPIVAPIPSLYSFNTDFLSKKPCFANPIFVVKSINLVVAS
jgi:hypothetical protein